MGLVHHIIFNLLTDQQKKFIAATSFRESGKSTITTLAYPLYIICEELIEFGIVISDTGMQSELMIANIKYELENNKLLLQDYGDLSTEYWGTKSIQTKTGIKFMARSKGQKVRGLKFRKKRPEIIIIDDPETLDDTRTKERRDKTYRWFFSEVLPARDKQTGRIFFIGNLLHTDCLLRRLQNKKNWHGYDIPLTLDSTESGLPTWSARYPNKAAILEEKENNDPIVWQREYLLKIVPEEGQIIKEQDIFKYSKIPQEAQYIASGVGVDLAISKKQTADNVAIIRGDVYLHKSKYYIYLSQIVQRKMGFGETIEMIKAVARNNDGSYANIFVEKVAYQQAAIEELEKEFLPVEGMPPSGGDKRARLTTASPIIKRGQVLFPDNGDLDDCITELVGFGIEAHDDTVDALVYLIRGIMQNGLAREEVVWL